MEYVLNAAIVVAYSLTHSLEHVIIMNSRFVAQT